MPQISKVRIVNFNYNDGKRLIADELYDFANRDQNNALNVLINLANGGGKSVLVQLMMQPIIPKAKVAGRAIESFFNKTSDHCFVLIEWFKDNSTEKLLTGIAMSASESAANLNLSSNSSEEDTSRGMSIKYYTFYSNYYNYTTGYDIVNLPLSRKEQKRFVAADFDTVRAIAKKSNGILQYYASDDSVKWRNKLAEYGLVQNEWLMMEKLNSEEGGLSKYFGSIKNSNQLIDKLLLPTIEGKLNQSHTKEDNSLATMLMSYAKQYVSQQDVLQEKESYEAFVKALEDFKPQAEELWNANDKNEENINKLFGLSDALGTQITQCKEEKEAIEQKLKDLEDKRKQILWEQASANYYNCQDEFSLASCEHLKASEIKDSLQRELQKTIQEIAILECADYYKKSQKLSGEIEGIRSEISTREKGGESSSLLASLKYSVYCDVSAKLEETTPILAEKRQLQEETNYQLSQLQLEQKKAEKAKTSAKSDYDRAKGGWEVAQTATDREVAKLGVDLNRRLDGLYPTEELDSIHKTKEKESNRLEEKLEKKQKEQESVEKKRLEIPKKISDISIQQHGHKEEKEKLLKSIKEYEEKETKIQEICNQYSLDFSLRFTDYMETYLRSEERNNTAKYSDILRKISVAQEAIQAAKRGSVHIPHAVIAYLNSTGVRYTTCEKYLLEQVEQNKITKERCAEILKHYPAVAYGILMDDSERERLFTYGREKWLPAMIPIFTYKHLEKILNIDNPYHGAIAFYSEEYFADKENYTLHLNEELQKLEQHRNFLIEKDEKIKKEIVVVTSFDYTKSWKTEQEKACKKLDETIQKCDEKIKELEKTQTTLEEKKVRIAREMNSINQKKNEINRFMDIFVNLQERIKEELALSTDVDMKQEILEQAEYKLSLIQKNMETLQTQEKELATQVKTLDEACKELLEVKVVVKDCTEVSIISEPWQKLWAQYNQLLASLNTEISELKEKLQDRLNRLNEYKDEISYRAIAFEQYEHVIYSSERVNACRQQKAELSDQLENARNVVSNALAQKVKAEFKFQSAQTALEPFGNPLEKSAIGTDFERRLANISEERTTSYKEKDQCMQTETNLNITFNRLSDYISSYMRPLVVGLVTLEESFDVQYREMVKEHKNSKARFDTAQSQVHLTLSDLQTHFSKDAYSMHNGVCAAIHSMNSLLSSNTRGDRYYTLTEHIESNIENANRAISKIMTDLKEFENNHNDLIHQCALQGRRIYEGLKQMASSSRVTVYNGRDKKQMIRFDIPNEVDVMNATTSIADEIDKGTKELVAQMNHMNNVDLRKMAEKIVGSKNLLRRYIGKDFIKVDAYKIDQNPLNAGYRTWEQTQVNNSGAEKFVVYFAVILSLINYTRGDIGSIRDKELRSVLILDNPFGATSSKHILEPMFAIAKHFHVQMVCLSDINKSDVINCFDIVIKAIVKKRPMSNNELLTHEGNELIEHGFYRSEQLSLLNW